MKKILVLFLLCISCVVFAGTSKVYFFQGSDSLHRSIRPVAKGSGSPGFAPVARVSVAPAASSGIDRSGIALEYIWGNTVNPGVGQIETCADTSGSGINAICDSESSKASIAVGKYVTITNGKGFKTASNPPSCSAWSMYFVSDTSPAGGYNVAFQNGQSGAGCVANLAGGNYSYGSGWGPGGSDLWGRWSGDSDLPWGVYAFTSDGTNVKKYYNGLIDGIATRTSIITNSYSASILCYQQPQYDYSSVGKHWYFALFNTAHDAARVSATSAILKSTYEVLQ